MATTSNLLSRCSSQNQQAEPKQAKKGGTDSALAIGLGMKPTCLEHNTANEGQKEDTYLEVALCVAIALNRYTATDLFGSSTKRPPCIGFEWTHFGNRMLTSELMRPEINAKADHHSAKTELASWTKCVAYPGEHPSVAGIRVFLKCFQVRKSPGIWHLRTLIQGSRQPIAKTLRRLLISHDTSLYEDPRKPRDQLLSFA